MTRQANKRELAWCERLQKLMEKMPPTMMLMTDGTLRACDREEYNNLDALEHFKALDGTGAMGFCEGGDPWK